MGGSARGDVRVRERQIEGEGDVGAQGEGSSHLYMHAIHTWDRHKVQATKAKEVYSKHGALRKAHTHTLRLCMVPEPEMEGESGSNVWSQTYAHTHNHTHTLPNNKRAAALVKRP